ICYSFSNSFADIIITFFFHHHHYDSHTAHPEIYTLSLHDALPISDIHRQKRHGHARVETTRVGIGKTRQGEPVSQGRRCHLRQQDRKSTRLNSSHVSISYAVFCLKKKKYSINLIAS